MRRIILLLAAVLSLKANALMALRAGPKTWVVPYGTEKNFLIDTISLDADGWPRLDSRQEFRDKSLALARIPVTAKPETVIGGAELLDPKGETLWPVTAQWNWDWELKYSEWVRTKLSTTFWSEHGIVTDCADLAYSARWIFARINGLPMANHLASGHWFTHRSLKPEWKSLPTAPNWEDDVRFRTALKYLLNFVYTHSLWMDSYPIEISARSIIPGAHHLSLFGSTGHTQLVHFVSTRPDEPPLLTLNSDMPPKVRDVAERLYLDGSFGDDRHGFLRMRWPIWVGGNVNLVRAEDMPYFSREQYDPAFVRPPREQFWQEIFFRLNPNVDFSLITKRLATQLVDMIHNRDQVVTEGYAVCSAKPCVEGSADWEAWSTPARDKRLHEVMGLFMTMLNESGAWPAEGDQVVLQQDGYAFTLKQMVQAWPKKTSSSNPNDPPLVRWGLHPDVVSARSIEQMQTLLGERDRFFADHPCAAPCAPGSPTFEAANPGEIDHRLRDELDIVPFFCELLGARGCSRIFELLDSTEFMYLGETKSAAAWLRELPFVNSDPRHDQIHRTFGFAREFAHRRSRDSQFKVGYRALIYLDDHATIWQRSGLEFNALNFPAGEKVIALDPENGWIWSRTNSHLIARSADFSTTLSHPAAKSESELQSLAYGSQLLADNGGVLEWYKIESGRIVKFRSLGPVTFTRGINRHLFATATAGADKRLVDLARGIDVPLPQEMVRDVRPAGSAYLVLSGDWTKPIECEVIGENGQRLRIQNAGEYCIEVNTDLRQVLVATPGGEARLRQFNADWTAHSDQSLGRYLSGESGVAVVRVGRDEIIYSLTHLGLQKMPPDFNRRIITGNHRFLISHDENKRLSKIWDVEQARVVGEYSGYAFFASDYAREGVITLMSNRATWILDTDHPERPSLLTAGPGEFVWTGANADFAREYGLLIYMNGASVYLHYPLEP